MAIAIARKTVHSDHKYSITIHKDDLPLVGCLRALSKYSQRTGNNQIPWGGTKDSDWEQNHHLLSFYFSTTEYRDLFISELSRLLPKYFWKEVGRSDNDPATPQR